MSLNAELLRSARREQQKILAEQMNIVLPKPLPDPQQLPKEFENPVFNSEIKQAYLVARNKLILELFVANILVMLISATASYFLAGKTLKPIEIMLEEQKKFIADASHELRTPVTALKTAIEVTLKMGPISHEKMSEILNSNLEDVNNLESLSNSLLSFEKYSGGIDSKSLSEIQLDKLIRETVERLKPLADKSLVKIKVDVVPLKVLGEYRSLSELISILIDNAIKYNKPNGNVAISITEDTNSTHIIVKDEGIGIAESNIPHIFERFYRVDGSRSKNITSGHGLGLAIAYNIIKNHGGKIDVKSELGKGTTFKVTFPKRRY